MSQAIDKAREYIKNADAVLITAGAGMANPEWFESNPKLAWAFYGHRLNLYRKYF